jgi:flagellar hook-basal body complex protein FliE
MNVGLEHAAFGNLAERTMKPQDKLAGFNPAQKPGQADSLPGAFGISLADQVQRSGESSASKGMLDGLVEGVDAKQKAAAESRRAFLAGESTNLHQTMIAGQEASVAFSLMVEMRNKVMEAYQELMRMQI